MEVRDHQEGTAIEETDNLTYSVGGARLLPVGNQVESEQRQPAARMCFVPLGTSFAPPKMRDCAAHPRDSARPSPCYSVLRCQ